MGIHGLMKLITEEAPESIKEVDLASLTGRKIAVDASMAIYQFLIAVRSMGNNGVPGAAAMLTNEAGEVTSHIQGMFSRTIRMMEAGCKPAYVFDGKPPDMKGGTLLKRSENRAKAEAELAAAKENDDVELINKFESRLVKVGKKENDECKQLLKLMGVPVIEAPCEAEAQCAELAKGGKVFATATEDMDALTFQTPKLLRKMTFAAGQKQPIVEIDVSKVLTGLNLKYEQFVDLCIMMGCDYMGTIKGVGPKTALQLIRQHGDLESIVKALLKNPKTKNNVPAEYTTQKVKKQTEEEAAAKEEEVEKQNLGIHDNDMSESKNELDESIKDEKKGGEDEDEETQEAKASRQAQEDAKRAAEEAEAERLMLEELNAGTTEAVDDNDHNNELNADEEGEYEIIEPAYIRARSLFHTPEVTAASEFELKWTEPDQAGLLDFLVEKMGFDKTRVENGIAKLVAAQKKKAQGRMDSFFTSAGTVTSSTGLKRKAEPVATKKGKAPAAKKGGFGKR